MPEDVRAELVDAVLSGDTAEIEAIVLRSHYAADGSVERIEVLEAPPLSLITPELLAQMDRPPYRDGDVLVLAPDVRYRIGAEYGVHGERLLHREASVEDD